MAESTVNNREELRILLNSPKIAERKKAVKYIGKNRILQLNNEVIDLLKKEYRKKRGNCSSLLFFIR